MEAEDINGGYDYRFQIDLKGMDWINLARDKHEAGCCENCNEPSTSVQGEKFNYLKKH